MDVETRTQFVSMIAAERRKRSVDAPTASAQAAVSVRACANGHMCVCVRRRPLNADEVAAGDIDVVTIPDARHVIIHEPVVRYDLSRALTNHVHAFDRVFDDAHSHEDVYATVRPRVMQLHTGLQLTVFMYGATGSGKTYTMSGLTDRALSDVFALADGRRLAVCVSFFEVYMSKVRDLLNGGAACEVREDGAHAVHVVGVTEHATRDQSIARGLIAKGLATRRVGSTRANTDGSSRSHAVLHLIVREVVQRPGEPASHPIVGRLSLVDLAGAEAAHDSNRGSSAADVTAHAEAAEINKSLLVLKECIRALGRGYEQAPRKGRAASTAKRHAERRRDGPGDARAGRQGRGNAVPHPLSPPAARPASVAPGDRAAGARSRGLLPPRHDRPATGAGGPAAGALAPYASSAQGRRSRSSSSASSGGRRAPAHVHIPFRGSKLTQVLRDCFTTPGAVTFMIATISPSSHSTEFSLNTLRYASRLKEIATAAADSEVDSVASIASRASSTAMTTNLLVENSASLRVGVLWNGGREVPPSADPVEAAAAARSATQTVVSARAPETASAPLRDPLSPPRVGAPDATKILPVHSISTTASTSRGISSPRGAPNNLAVADLVRNLQPARPPTLHPPTASDSSDPRHNRYVRPAIEAVSASGAHAQNSIRGASAGTVPLVAAPSTSATQHAITDMRKPGRESVSQRALARAADAAHSMQSATTVSMPPGGRSPTAAGAPKDSNEGAAEHLRARLIAAASAAMDASKGTAASLDREALVAFIEAQIQQLTSLRQHVAGLPGPVEEAKPLDAAAAALSDVAPVSPPSVRRISAPRPAVVMQGAAPALPSNARVTDVAGLRGAVSAYLSGAAEAAAQGRRQEAPAPLHTASRDGTKPSRARAVDPKPAQSTGTSAQPANLVDARLTRERTASRASSSAPAAAPTSIRDAKQTKDALKQPTNAMRAASLSKATAASDPGVWVMHAGAAARPAATSGPSGRRPPPPPPGAGAASGSSSTAVRPAVAELVAPGVPSSHEAAAGHREISRERKPSRGQARTNALSALLAARGDRDHRAPMPDREYVPSRYSDTSEPPRTPTRGPHGAPQPSTPVLETTRDKPARKTAHASPPQPGGTRPTAEPVRATSGRGTQLDLAHHQVHLLPRTKSGGMHPSSVAPRSIYALGVPLPSGVPPAAAGSGKTAKPARLLDVAAPLTGGLVKLLGHGSGRPIHAAAPPPLMK